jgi:hypothetical protein
MIRDSVHSDKERSVPHSKILTAIAGCCRKSQRDSPDAWTRTKRSSLRWPIWRARCAVPRRRTASTRSGRWPVCGMQTGRTGTPSTLRRSSPVGSSRNRVRDDGDLQRQAVADRAFGLKAAMCSARGHVCFGSKADMCSAARDVRFTPNSDIDCVGPIMGLPINYVFDPAGERGA